MNNAAPGYSWKFYLSPEQAWEAMYHDCSQATKSIEYEQYMFENDAVGRRFLELFITKAAQGVKILLVCDTFGSKRLHMSPLVRKLKRSGGRFFFYNPISKWDVLRPWRWFPRTHTKTLLIDSAVAYTGGVCLDGRMRHWRDTHVRFTGEAVAYVRHAFDRLENSMLRRFRYQRRTPPVPEPQVEDRRFIYKQSLPRVKRHKVYEELVQAVKGAQHSICIETAYFVANDRFYSLLGEAVARGVEVKVIVPGCSDVKLADWICLTYSPRLLRMGVRIFHYESCVLHCKTVIIDGKWATVGSTNMDVISFFFNREGNLITTDEEAVAQLRSHFEDDLAHSTEMTAERWAQVPVWKKAAGFLGRSLKLFFAMR